MASSKRAPRLTPTRGLAGISAGSRATVVAGTVRGEQTTGSPMCPKSGDPRTGDPKLGRQDWLGQEPHPNLWLLRRETQSRSPGRPQGSAGDVFSLLIRFLILVVREQAEVLRALFLLPPLGSCAVELAPVMVEVASMSV